MKLTTEQIREFYHRGYVKIPGVISNEMVDTARQAINYSIGTLSPKGLNLAKHHGGEVMSNLNSSPMIKDLYHKSPVVSLTESLLGEGNFKVPIGRTTPRPNRPVTSIIWAMGETANQKGPIIGASPALASFISPMSPSLIVEISRSGPGPIMYMRTI